MSDIIRADQITGKADLSALSIFHPENMDYVKKVIAPNLANKFHQDREDVEQELWLKLCKSAQSLPDIESPKSFCFTAARNICLNQERRAQLEVKYLESLKTQDIHSTRKSAGGGTMVVHRATATTPEDELLKSELRERLLKILKSLPPDKARLFRLFLSGKSPKEISELTGIPLKTVYGVLKRIQKDLIKELGLEQTPEQEPGESEK